MATPAPDAARSRWLNVFLMEWLFLVAALVLLGAYLVYGQWREHRQIHDRERERLLAVADVLHDNVGRQLDTINRALVNIRDELPRWRQSGPTLGDAHRRLKAYSDAMTGVRTLAILDREGTVLASNRAEIAGRNFRHRDYFQTASALSDPETLCVGPPYVTVLGVFALNVARTVSTPAQTFDGIVTATLDPDEFKILLQSVRYAADMQVAIFHGHGRVFMVVPHPGKAPDERAAASPPWYARHLVPGPSAGFAVVPAAPGARARMVALRSVQPVDVKMDTALVVVAHRDVRTVFAQWRYETWVKAVLFSLLVVSSAGLLFLLQRRQSQAARDAVVAADLLHRKNAELELLNRQLHAQSAQLRSLALVDGLTGVANRRRLDEQLDAEWRRCLREACSLAVLMVDVDHFKRYNDRYGHQAGDACLQVIAQALQAGLARSHDLVARYGGEEFVCLLPDCDRVGALFKAEDLRSAVEALALPHEASDTGGGVVTISVGVAVLRPSAGGRPEDVLAQADRALYRAKHQGRNRVYASPDGAAEPASGTDTDASDRS
jgi:diguanylate cyclase (GGDEF)-like protein